MVQLTHSHWHRRVCKRRPGKEFPHLNRNPNQKDLNDHQHTLTAVNEVNGLGVQLATTNQSSFAFPCVYRVQGEMERSQGGTACRIQVERRAVEAQDV